MATVIIDDNGNPRSEPSGTAANELTRCTGECCKAFPVGGMTLDELRALHAEKRILDGDVVLDMLIPLGTHKVPPGHHPKSLLGEKEQPFFTCRHFNNGGCDIYEHRPDMCKRYPYDHDCEYVEAALCTRTVSP